MTTAAAVVTSTALYLRNGDPYLARGVVGDLAGFAVLAALLVSSGRRARHEAFVCLGCISAVLVVEPDWPLRSGPAVWWTAVAAGLGGYLVLRATVLRSGAPGSRR
ncbi:MAG: hypothetical protein M3011_08190 [Actinomycetota bacterium]|nr:hypothetical protein [Actinomycetota bacterium]